MSQVKERPILFLAPMVRAILEGRKTVTRRAVKTQPRSKADIGSYGLGQPFIRNPDVTKPNPECPYGRPGDRLWVRETWQDVHPVQVIDRYSQLGRAGIPGPPGVTYQTIYRADGEYPKVHYTHEHPYRCIVPDPNHGFLGPADSGWTGWTPSIHMPRWASRILLEITDVRVERLQDISEDQCIAEGIHPVPKTNEHSHQFWRDYHLSGDGTFCVRTPKESFKSLWCHVAGGSFPKGEAAYKASPHSWDANPWVWVVEFKRAMP
ncbi:hypothetical protein [Pseudomonas sp. FP2338]|uniref:hypothetical protein n=1 Tax=Pseudomonas sp. FP2338 TaxID=2954093 RepID=UPI0027345997|nr:hypothetical protein [Pseudomonas sp. FP2338]WLH85992.1 hypothetical protein PSH96_05975 [Pseudomonas sp. FP2338]